MAKLSKVVANARRRAMAAKYADRRLALKALVRGAPTWVERMAAQEALSALPRDASPVRSTHRCPLTGRPRGFLRRFQMSRLAFRELALRGLIPGVTKSSW